MEIIEFTEILTSNVFTLIGTSCSIILILYLIKNSTKV